MSNDIIHVVGRFPDYSRESRLLAMRDHHFRTMCKDYGKCVEAVKYWRQGVDETSQERVREYQCLCMQFEKEILEALQMYKHG